ncbi:MAG: HEAT repeat domain-containing protein [Methylotenera sp.]|nr:HEAT repeat domain-containing protein [Methylotenera sp.]
MVFATLSDPKTRLAFWIGAIALILTIVLLVEIIRIRMVLYAKKVRKNRFIHLWQPVLIKTIAGETPKLPTLHARDIVELLLLWLRFQNTLRGDSRLHLNRLLTQLLIKPTLLKMLTGSKTDERLIALATVGFLGTKEARADLVVALNDPQPAISVLAAHALLSINDSDSISHVIPMMVGRRDWPIDRTAIMLKDASPKFVEAFLVEVEQAAIDNQPYLLRLLRILDVLQLSRPLEFLRHILENSNNPELVTSTLKLVRLNSDLDLVRNRLNDENWAVQVQVAAVLGRLGVSEDVPRLVSLMSSKDWWVRYRAAKSLVQLPFINHAKIEVIKQNMNDAFGYDILLHAIAEQAES